MADGPSSDGSRHLDALGQRDVVYCHQCSHEWYQDEHGLACPNCSSEITEIVSPESDPRPGHDEEPEPPPDFRDIQRHNPWQHDAADSDPEEADIEEHVQHGPGGSVFISQTIRSSRPPRVAFGTRPSRRNARPQDGPDPVIADFQNMVNSMMGPTVRQGQTGRSGADTLFSQGQFGGNTFQTSRGPNVVGGRFTFHSGPIRPRDADGPQPGVPPVEDIATLIGNLFGAMGEPAGHDHDHRGPGMPPNPLQGLFASLLNPANARHGDAVYSQEALDEIISTLMEQHPTSNAPGPASPDAISSLPKKKIDEKMLGPEGKAECSVCMDDVILDEEVVTLPCSHWFHEQCASMWLSEHNTCPICRKGIEGEATPTSNSRRSSNSRPASRSERRLSRISLGRPRMSRDNTSGSRNEARLDAIRQSGRLSPTEETQGSTTMPTGSARRWQAVGDGSSPHISQPRERSNDSDPSRDMPGSFSSFTRHRDRQNARRESIGRGSGHGNTSGSDHSRSSRRSSRSGDSTGNGPMNWLRDRFGSGRSHD
ncbi:putative RING finger protein [Lachnellula occidentalis]|uniref:RING-type E3 ubiquitin transferase n=1 Tax=Lachnellula occidentalis TaxID=215460 RepID=A0A8H8S262_9HELO|nr:putative RING finger protein [Lachnellula occidentalis]